jgi:hypothetical protein
MKKYVILAIILGFFLVGNTYAEEDSCSYTGYAASFDGIDDLITLTDNTLTGQYIYSVNMWVYRDYDTTPTSGWGAFIDFGRSDFGRRRMIHQGAGMGGGYSSTMVNEVIVLINTPTHDYTYTRDILPAGWNMLTFNREASSYHIYINGIDQQVYFTNWNYTHGAPLWHVGTGNKMIGAKEENYYYEGLMDEVSYFNRTLSQTEITELYDSGTLSGIDTTGLVAHYPFDGDFNDYSGNGNDGLPQGGVTFVDGINACPPPVFATVDIDPDTLNLKAKGVFTTYITLDGRDVEDIVSVACEGTLSVRTSIEDGVLVAKFNRADLVGVGAGDAVELTVTGELEDGTAFEGSDTVRVISKGKK